jgi:hypothetical protein
MTFHRTQSQPSLGTMPPNNSLQLTRLACGKLDGAVPARMRGNEGAVARAAGQLSSKPLDA